jgi:hypothetical protein
MTIHIRRKARSHSDTPWRPMIWHAIETEEGDQVDTRPALCGFKPGHPWVGEEGREVTCPLCLSKLGGRTDPFVQPRKEA